jgi:hypothetical protein
MTMTIPVPVIYGLTCLKTVGNNYAILQMRACARKIQERDVPVLQHPG